MSIVQFENFYFDPKDIIAIDTNPRGFDDKIVEQYMIHIKDVGPILLKGEAARKCFAEFFGES